MALISILFQLAIFLLPLIVPATIRPRTMFLGYSLLISALLAGLWINHFWEVSRPNYSGHFADSMGTGFAMVITLSHIIGVLVGVTRYRRRMHIRDGVRT
jgi:hypothetical protein